MALTNPIAPDEIARWAKLALNTPHNYVWSSYDAEGDVLYVNFKKPAVATDSELTDDDMIVRFEGEEVIGVTILHASTRTCEQAEAGGG
jgi:uncharacterized protein YuzE